MEHKGIEPFVGNLARITRHPMACPELVGGLGIEPRFADSKAAVLPLDEPPVERPGRFELPTPCLEGRCSTPELRPQMADD